MDGGGSKVTPRPSPETRSKPTKLERLSLIERRPDVGTQTIWTGSDWHAVGTMRLDPEQTMRGVYNAAIQSVVSQPIGRRIVLRRSSGHHLRWRRARPQLAVCAAGKRRRRASTVRVLELECAPADLPIGRLIPGSSPRGTGGGPHTERKRTLSRLSWIKQRHCRVHPADMQGTPCSPKWQLREPG